MKYIEVIQTRDERINPFVTKEFSDAFQQASQGKRILVWQPSKTSLEQFEKSLFCTDNLVWIRGDYQGDFQGFDKVIVESPEKPIINLDCHLVIINPGYDINEDEIDSYTVLRRFE